MLEKLNRIPGRVIEVDTEDRQGPLYQALHKGDAVIGSIEGPLLIPQGYDTRRFESATQSSEPVDGWTSLRSDYRHNIKQPQELLE